MNNTMLGDLLFPNLEHTTEYYESKYPLRRIDQEAKVCRLGPSPTGFIHLGNLYGALVDERLSHQSGGSFYLRIEDTDDKRKVDGAIDKIIDGLAFFDIRFDEGVNKEGELGDYGPYTQSERVHIYHAFAKKLVNEGKAYPCFLTEDEISKIRAEQENNKKTPGIYGDYAKSRFLSFDEIKSKIEAGEEYVLRLKSCVLPPDAYEDSSQVIKVRVNDGIRGSLEMPANFQDVVLLKKNGIPTYHFAHVIDDHLMRTTHVVRGAEWLSTLPIHVELFNTLGFDLPVYCHTAQLMKLDENGNKRKLSKREDPELSLNFYREEGYHPLAVKEYLLTILNSDFEEWRADHLELSCDEFPFKLEKMSNSGALFDLNKLKDISKDVLFRLNAEALFDFLKRWSEEFRPDLDFMFTDKDYLLQILDLGRNDAKPRKDFISASQMVEFISYFFDKLFRIEDEMSIEVKGYEKQILTMYLDTYNHDDSQEQWFEKIREIAGQLGYALKPKDYKKNPDQYKGHVGHVSSVIRIALVGRSTSPDVWAIQQIMGEQQAKARFQKYCQEL